jgi:hypothetical protein
VRNIWLLIFTATIRAVSSAFVRTRQQQKQNTPKSFRDWVSNLSQSQRLLTYIFDAK